MIVKTIRQAKPSHRRFLVVRGEVWETGTQASGYAGSSGPLESDILEVEEVPVPSEPLKVSFQPASASIAAWLHSLPDGLDEERCDCCGGPLEDAPGCTVEPKATNPGDVQKN